MKMSFDIGISDFHFPSDCSSVLFGRDSENYDELLKWRNDCATEKARNSKNLCCIIKNLKGKTRDV